MAQLVVNIASALRQFGVKEGDVLGICCENRTEVLTTAIAGWAIGAVITFINSAYSKGEEITYFLYKTNISIDEKIECINNLFVIYVYTILFPYLILCSQGFKYK